MGVIKVEPASLQALAARCELASDLVASSGLVVRNGSFQPSLAAVSVVHATVTATAQTLATGLWATAGKLSAAAAEYDAQDQSNSAAVEAVKL
jgi:hypothetical protein